MILIGAIWAWYLFNRLWQGALTEQASGAIQAAAARGLSVEEPGFAPRLVARGEIEGQAVVLEWRGGVLGTRSRLSINGQKRWGPLISDAAGLDAGLDAALEGAAGTAGARGSG